MGESAACSTIAFPLLERAANATLLPLPLLSLFILFLFLFIVTNMIYSNCSPQNLGTIQIICNPHIIKLYIKKTILKHQEKKE